jgi:hypothetical protein
MKRLTLLAVLPLLGGCMFPQGWHWPRTGASTTVTVVYVQNDVASWQGDYLAWTTGYYNGHPELAIRLVDTCPAGVNCIRVVTQEISPSAGLTGISTGSSPHILTSLLRLDPDVGRVGTVFGTRLIFFHEFCHALGGGFRDDIHHLCNWDWRASIFSEIARVYHDDHG